MVLSSGAIPVLSTTTLLRSMPLMSTVDWQANLSCQAISAWVPTLRSTRVMAMLTAALTPTTLCGMPGWATPLARDVGWQCLTATTCCINSATWLMALPHKHVPYHIPTRCHATVCCTCSTRLTLRRKSRDESRQNIIVTYIKGAKERCSLAPFIILWRMKAKI